MNTSVYHMYMYRELESHCFKKILFQTFKQGEYSSCTFSKDLVNKNVRTVFLFFVFGFF